MNGEGGMQDGLRQVVRVDSPVRRGLSTYSRVVLYSAIATNHMCLFKCK